MSAKKIYEAPVLDVIHFTVEDIMTTSGGGNGNGGSGGGGIELPDHVWG